MQFTDTFCDPHCLFSSDEGFRFWAKSDGFYYIVNRHITVDLETSDSACNGTNEDLSRWINI